MSILDNLSDSADQGSAASKKLVSKSYEYSKLKVFQITTLSISMIVKLFIIGSFAFLGLVFVAFFCAIVLGEYLQNSALGYLIISASLFLFAIVMYLIRKYFDRKIISKISKIFFKESI